MGQVACVQLGGAVTEIRDRAKVLEGKIRVGDPITMWYRFAPDPWEATVRAFGSGSRATYSYDAPPYGIDVRIGNYSFRSDPDNVNLVISLSDQTSLHTYQVQSPRPNLFDIEAFNPMAKMLATVWMEFIGKMLPDSWRPLPPQNQISLRLSDSTGQALPDLTLRRSPPDLGAWDTQFFWLRSWHCFSSFSIRGQLESAARCR